MRWKLFATLSETVGSREVSIDTQPETTLDDALEALFDAHPELREEVLDEDGELYDHIRLLRNGHDPFTNDAGFDTVVGDNDELALFPPVSGG